MPRRTAEPRREDAARGRPLALVGRLAARRSVLLATRSRSSARSGYVVIEGWNLLRRVLHDRHHDDDRRVRRGPPAVARRARCSTSASSCSASRPFFYTFTLLHGAAGRRGPARSGGPGGAGTHARRTPAPLHRLRLRAHGADHRPGVLAAERAVRHHRARPRSHARRRSRRATSPSRRTPAARTVLQARAASTARAGSSPRSAPMRRTSTRSSRRACCGRTCSSSAARRPTMRGRSW